MSEDVFKLLKASKETFEIMRSKTALVYHQNSILRSSVSKTLSDLGIPAQMISILSGSYQELESELIQAKPDIVITSNEIIGGTFEEMLRVHEGLKTDRLSSSFFLLSEDGSLAVALAQLECFIDGFIVVPFTPHTLTNTLLERIEEKLSASKVEKMFNMAREKFLLKEYDQANFLFEKASEIEEVKSMSLVFLGKISVEKNEKKKALEYYSESYEHCDENYMCLLGYIHLLMDQRDFKTAYDINKVFVNKFPTRPELVKNTVLLALANHKYDDIAELVDIIPSLKSISQKKNNILAVGLIMCAKNLFLQNYKEAGLKAIVNCFDLGPDRFRILDEACLILASNGYSKKAMKLLESNSGIELSKATFLQIQMEIYFASKDYEKIMKVGQNLAKVNTSGSRCHKIFLDAAAEMKLNANQVNEILKDAKEKFPDEKFEFKGMK